MTMEPSTSEGPKAHTFLDRNNDIDPFSPDEAPCEEEETPQIETALQDPPKPQFVEGLCDEGGSAAAEQDAVAVYKGPFEQKRSTPEKIRRRANKLYDEVHEMIDRYETRNDRQKDIRRRDSAKRGSSIGTEKRRSTSKGGRRSSSRDVQKTQLPDLQKTFEESRRQHLLQAQSQRSEFPPARGAQDPSKDPGAFSVRFQSISGGPQY